MLIGNALAGFILDRETRNCSEKTAMWYRSRLSGLLDFLKEQGVTTLEEITVHHLRAFIVHLQKAPSLERHPYRPTESKPITAQTLRGYVRAFKAFFNWCYVEELLPKDPSARVSMPKAPEYIIPTFKPEHLAAMFDACDVKTELGFRDYTILLVLLDTGIRLGELVGLKTTDVHDTYLTVFGKGSKQREVGVGPSTATALWKYIHKFRKPRDEDEMSVFIGRMGEQLQEYGVYEVFRGLKVRAGIEGIRCSPHTLRHTMARMWLENGGEVFKLSRVLGHTTVNITQMYLKDYQSRQAREDQILYSPVESLKKRQRGRPRKKK